MFWSDHSFALCITQMYQLTQVSRIAPIWIFKMSWSKHVGIIWSGGKVLVIQMLRKPVKRDTDKC